MGSKKHTADAFLHDMSGRINFYSQKEMETEKHMADVVLPVVTN
jgi:hypothetical protein